MVGFWKPAPPELLSNELAKRNWRKGQTWLLDLPLRTLALRENRKQPKLL